jgi:hypothetical protein
MKAELGLGRALLLSVLIFAMLSAGLTLYPLYSPEAAIASGLLTVGALIAAAITAKLKSWWGQVAWTQMVMLFGLGIAIRAGADAFGGTLYWPLSLILLYGIAWSFPWLAPLASSKLLKEQLAPETKLGRGCQAFSLSLIPGVGAFALLVQRITSETGLEKLDSFMIALIFAVAAIGVSQAFAHQFWEKRPGASAGATP